jgi:hypothetical protein
MKQQKVGYTNVKSMGNIRQHAIITTHVIRQIRSKRPNDEYKYVYMGNYLTDMSQFRDPYANFLAKKIIRKKAESEAYIFAILFSAVSPSVPFHSLIDNWIDDLLGEAKPKKRYGALARFMTHFARALTHQMFDSDSPVQTQYAIQVLQRLSGIPIYSGI